MATAALFTKPSILGRGDSADLPQKLFTAAIGEKKPGCLPVGEVDGNNVQQGRVALSLKHQHFTAKFYNAMMRNIQMYAKRR